MSRLNEQFLAHRGPTDVLTFDYRDQLPLPGDDEPVAIGEIVVCPEVAAEAAAREGTAYAWEVLLYMVHGMLHLAGYDDHTPPACARMRRAEKRIMRALLQDGSLEGIFP